MVLVTGAAGKTGRAAIRALAARGEAVRAFVRRDEQVATVRASGALEVAVGDLRDEAALRGAAAGVRAVYHICPNMSPDEVLIGRVAIAAARAHEVQHLLFHSVLHPQTEGMPHHWQKMRVEEALLESGLTFTIVQPAPYMQNVLAGWEAITVRGVYAVPYSAATRLSLVDLHDVAEAAALILTEPGHLGATYELVGTAAMTQHEVAAALGEALARPVRAVSESIESWAGRMRAAGLGEYQVGALTKMFRYYERHGLGGNPNVLGWILRRPPATFAAFVARRARGGETDSA